MRAMVSAIGIFLLGTGGAIANAADPILCVAEYFDLGPTDTVAAFRQAHINTESLELAKVYEACSTLSWSTEEATELKVSAKIDLKKDADLQLGDWRSRQIESRKVRIDASDKLALNESIDLMRFNAADKPAFEAAFSYLMIKNNPLAEGDYCKGMIFIQSNAASFLEGDYMNGLTLDEVDSAIAELDGKKPEELIKDCY
jgi:hypothetical protein